MVRYWPLLPSVVSWSRIVSAKIAVLGHWEKMVSDGQTVHFWPHSVIHNRKAVHLTCLKLGWKVNFWPPLKRQNFRDAYGLNCYPHPISCHKKDKLTRENIFCIKNRSENLLVGNPRQWVCCQGQSRLLASFTSARELLSDSGVGARSSLKIIWFLSKAHYTITTVVITDVIVPCKNYHLGYGTIGTGFTLFDHLTELPVYRHSNLTKL